jgi:glucose-1-phosphate thymidylyltransferase
MVDVIILAGGFAKRMWPLTKNKPKQLLPIAGRPMLGYTLDPLQSLEEVDRIFISTNDPFKDQFRDFLKDYVDSRIELFIEPSMDQEEKLGAIGGLGYLIREKGLDKDTMIIGGDNLFEFQFSDPLTAFAENKKDLVAVYDVGTKERAKLYGIVDPDERGIIKRFLEKPEDPPSTLAATALYIFCAETMGMVNRYLEDGGKRDALGYFIAYLIERRPVYAWKLPGMWFDIGSLEMYHEADEYFKNQIVDLG